MNLGQPGWRWCQKCEGMFFARNATKGICPADGAEHDDSQSGAYLLHLEESPAPGQDDWRWCQKCEGLFFNAHPSRCPADSAPHDPTASGNYILHMTPPATLGQSDWRWCHKCAGLYFAGNPSPGICTAGGPHEDRGSGDYRPRVAGQYAFDRAAFFAQYTTLFRETLKANQTNALSQLLDFMEQDFAVTDLRWFANMLATVKRECGNGYRPISEIGCDDSRSPVCSPIPENSRTYGNPLPCPNLQLSPPQPCPGGQPAHTYYGRGYVQITKQGNYRALGAAIGVGDQFVHRPETVLDAAASYSIMSVGMRRGLFTRRRLDQFINDTTLDYRNARRIINPGDTATFSVIAAHAQTFQTLLEASVR